MFERSGNITEDYNYYEVYVKTGFYRLLVTTNSKSPISAEYIAGII